MKLVLILNRLLKLIFEKPLTPSLPINRSAALRLGTTKATLKSPALQTLRADEALPDRAPASGVGGTSAPLWLSDGSNQESGSWKEGGPWAE